MFTPYGLFWLIQIAILPYENTLFGAGGNQKLIMVFTVYDDVYSISIYIYI